MSSSNIIKTKNSPGYTIETYRFDAVNDYVFGQVTGTSRAFVPFLDTMLGATAPSESTQATDAGSEYTVDDTDDSSSVIQQGIAEEEHFVKVQEAYDKGFEEGKRQAERGLANVFKALRDAVEDLVGLRLQVLRESEEDLLQLAIMVARKVIHQEVATDRLILAKIVAAAINSTSERDEIILRLNPEDYRLVTAHKNIYLSGFANDRMLELKPDETISHGGCIVDTVMGEIDARTDSQVDEIFKKLLEERSKFVDLSAKLSDERDAYAYEED